MTWAAMSMPWTSWRCSADVPKMANHVKLPSAGTMRTPATNSAILRPREMRATKEPTKGAQAIHQAQ